MSSTSERLRRARHKPTTRVAALGTLALACVALLASAGAVVAAGHDISIVDFAFQPVKTTVFVGEPVTWTNASGRDHTVTSDDGTELDSGHIAGGEAYGHVFETAGTYAYHCAIHPDSMAGTITVLEAPATATSSGEATPTPPTGTLPPNFSPFPSTAADSAPPSQSPTPGATPIPADTTGGSGGAPLLLLLGVTAGAAIAVAWLRRRRAA